MSKTAKLNLSQMDPTINISGGVVFVKVHMSPMSSSTPMDLTDIPYFYSYNG